MKLRTVVEDNMTIRAKYLTCNGKGYRYFYTVSIKFNEIKLKYEYCN